MYLELLKKCVLDMIYSPKIINTNTNATSKQIDEGLYWPDRAHTMIGYKRLTNVQELFEDVIKNNIEGDLMETGVWRGGCTIFMKGMCEYYKQNRKVYVADSFAGLPPPNARYPADVHDICHTFKELAISYDTVVNNFKKYDLYDDKVIFLKGFFEDTLKKDLDVKLSILRLDGDMYSSTIQVLESMYDKVTDGGYVIIDDYGALSNCKAAVDDFRKVRNIDNEITWIDWTGIYWKK